LPFVIIYTLRYKALGIVNATVFLGEGCIYFSNLESNVSNWRKQT
jgi:hypothetical protein